MDGNLKKQKQPHLWRGVWVASPATIANKAYIVKGGVPRRSGGPAFNRAFAGTDISPDFFYGAFGVLREVERRGVSFLNDQLHGVSLVVVVG